jgi:phosphatidate phosphatase PAH1
MHHVLHTRNVCCVSRRIGSTELKAYIYFLHWQTKIVISDIDGTITKSDVLGHLFTAMGLDWSHPGIAQLLTNIRHNGYLVMYLSSRSISQANITRDFINTLVQGVHRMPVGPVIISPHGLLPSLYREMIKIATLQDIRALFPSDWNPFYGGFGNRDTDEISYRKVGVQPSRIFIINPKGELRPATLAVRSSTLASLRAINDLVHDIFPPLTGQSGTPTSVFLPAAAAVANAVSVAVSTAASALTAAAAGAGPLVLGQGQGQSHGKDKAQRDSGGGGQSPLAEGGSPMAGKHGTVSYTCAVRSS